ncbi:MAG: hypothetical protein HGB23_06905 [Chlorobiaceae bacterium]|nr:hypothetical protein [Chlorobiaceae bacterium]
MSTSTNSYSTSVTIQEDTSVILKIADFIKNYTPIAGDALKVQITTPEINGSLKFFNGTSWVDVSPRQVISAADIAAGKLMFTPDKDENGKDYTSIGFKVVNAKGETSSTSSLKINVTAVNDAAVISGTSSGLIKEESGNYGVNGKLTASDIDSAATFVAQNAVKGEYGQFSISKDGSWSYTADNAKLQELGGEKANATETFTVKTADGTTKEIAVTLKGVDESPKGSRNENNRDRDNDDSHHGEGGHHDKDDSHHGDDDHHESDEHEESEHNQGGTINNAPTVLAPLASTSAEGSSSYTLNLLDGAIDVDSGDTLSVGSLVTYSVDGAVASSIAPAGVSLIGSTLTVDPTNEVFNQLAVGQSMTILVSYSVMDTKGASVTQTETIKVTGTNDGPVAVVSTSAAMEGSAVVTGYVTSTDADAGATANYVLDAAVAGLTLNSDGSYSFDPANEAYQSLAAGEPKNLVATYSVTDDQGAKSSSTLTITVTGTNDAPVAAVATAGATEDGSIVTGAVSSRDVDAGATAIYSQDAPVDGLSLNSDGSYSFDPAHEAYQSLAEGEMKDVVANFTVTDDKGASSSSTLNITVTGTNDSPVAAVATAAATEDGSIVTGAVSSTDVDAGATATYSLDVAVDGLSLNSDGSYSFDPAHEAYQSLAEGEMKDVVANFTVTDDKGASSSSTLTITVTGANDDPAITGVVNSVNVNENQTAVTTVNASDVDQNDTLSYSIVETSGTDFARFAIDDHGVLSFVSAPDHENPQDIGGVDGDNAYVVDVQVADGHGGIDTQTLTVSVQNILDAPSPYTGTGDSKDFDTSGDKPFSINGTKEDQTLTGDSRANTIDALAGKDTVYGKEGNDTINGGVGDDNLYGQAGDDTINGGSEKDTIYGGSGNDLIHGNDNNDTIYGGSGSDTIYGDGGTNTIYGGYGADSLHGGSGGSNIYKYIDLHDTGDSIYDFDVANDKLDFKAIDANSVKSGSQSFSSATYFASPNHLVANGISYFDDGEGNTVVWLDNDGDATTVEMQVTLVGIAGNDLNGNNFTASGNNA